MQVARTESALLAALVAARAGGASVGLVPTMGALHEGHVSLVDRARAENDVVAVSIFVNPKQFDDARDLAAYPRTEAEDLAKLDAAGADVVMVGGQDDIFPQDFVTAVEVGPPVTSDGEGGKRPGHFRGVTTVVAKLFGMFAPTRAYFGWKDMQQCCVIRRMVRDLSIPVMIVPCPVVREPDGLACSSRNERLTPEHRALAPRLHAALSSAREAWRAGERRGERLTRLVTDGLPAALAADYVEVRDEVDYRPVEDPVGGGRLVAAVRLGGVRLLDNLPLE